MPILLILGIAIMIAGLALFAAWFEFFVILIKALLPFGIIVLGGVLTYFGWEEKRDKLNAFAGFSSPDEASRYQAEALAYQKKLNVIKEEKPIEEPQSSEPNPPHETLETSEALDLVVGQNPDQ